MTSFHLVFKTILLSCVASCLLLSPRGQAQSLGGATIQNTPVILAGDGLGNGVAATPAKLASLLVTQTGCTTAGYAWVPATNTCTPSASPTAANVAAAITTQTGCATAGYAWIPASNTCVAAATPTAANIAAAIATQTGCATAGYVWVPASNTCVVVASGSGTVSSGTAGQVSVYGANGTVVSGVSVLPVANLPVFVASGTGHAGGAVPDPGPTSGTTRYLNENGTFVAPLAPLPLPAITNIIKGNGAGQGIAAVAGTDYVVPGTAVVATQLPAFTGDVTTPVGSSATTVSLLQGTALALGGARGKQCIGLVAGSWAPMTCSNGLTFYVSDYASAGDFAQQIQACHDAAIAAGAGSTCDASGLTSTSIATATHQITIGNNTTYVTLKLPSQCVWQWNMNSSTAYGILQYGESKIEGQGIGSGGGRCSLAPATGAVLNAVYGTVAGSNNFYLQASGFSIKVDQGTVNYAARIEGLADQSWIHDIFASNTTGGDVWLWAGNCCTVHGDRLQGYASKGSIGSPGSYYSPGGTPLTVGYTSGGGAGEFGTAISYSTFNAPGPSKHNILINGQVAGFTLDHDYMEGNGSNDTTTSMVYDGAGGEVNLQDNTSIINCTATCASKYAYELHGPALMIGNRQMNTGTGGIGSWIYDAVNGYTVVGGVTTGVDGGNAPYSTSNQAATFQGGVYGSQISASFSSGVQTRPLLNIVVPYNNSVSGNAANIQGLINTAVTGTYNLANIFMQPSGSNPHTGTVNGMGINVQNIGTGLVSNANGLAVQVGNNTGTGSISNANGILIQSPKNSAGAIVGAITNPIGLNIAQQFGKAINQQSATDTNFFAGTIQANQLVAGGIVKATTTAGTLTLAIPGTDYVLPTGSVASLNAVSALPSGTTATTQTALDSSAKVATTAYADAAVAAIGGTLTFTQINTTGTTPTGAAGPGLGTTPTCCTLTGNDIVHTINFTTGTVTTGSNMVAVTVTFGGTHTTAPKAVIFGTNSGTGASRLASVFYSNLSTTGYTLNINGSGFVSTTAYEYTALAIW